MSHRSDGVRLPSVNAFGHRVAELGETLRAPNVLSLVRRQLQRLLSQRGGLDASVAGQIAQRTIRAVTYAPSRENAVLAARAELSPLGLLAGLRGGLPNRSWVIARQVEPFVFPGAAFDFGCGDGEEAASLSETCKDTTFSLYDVFDYRTARSRLLPWADFDTLREGDVASVLLLTVLHHCQDPLDLIRRIAALRPARVITIESVYGVGFENLSPVDTQRLLQENRDARSWLRLNLLEQFDYACFWDWFYNQVINTDVVVPHNYLPPPEWAGHWRTHGYAQQIAVCLGIDQPLVPEFHVLQVFDFEGTEKP